VLPTVKAGEYAVSVEFNDGQNEAQTRDLEYKVFNGLWFSVNGVKFKMIKVSGYSGGAFYIGETEVTQALWKAVMGNNENPSNNKGDKLPVEQVSWSTVSNNFMSALNNKIAGKNFRLPSSAEWEFAAKGGKESQNYTYSGSNTLSDVGWYKSNSGSKTHEVATKKANELGIYDMAGNVWEWCSDKYASNFSESVIRGASWSNESKDCEITFSHHAPSSTTFNDIGFRLALTINE
ncbi:MAG: formylglycine-generating enzyme family protein, partial [Bacteroidales bacterium]|nr:formylglycine-generating enzyme family protein [Bacteroidales bacterium]